ncbi:hypothetical protein Tco_0027302 [Tanacetum coccineum]
MVITEVIHFSTLFKEHFVGVQTALFKEVKVMEEIFDQMNDEVDQNTVDKQCAEIERKTFHCKYLEAEMSKVHNESKHISKLEREYLNLQLKYQHLQESFDNKKSQASQEAPDFNSFFKIKNLEHQIQEKDNIKDLKAQLEGNLKVATRSSVKPKVLAPGMYAIDVKPIPHPLKNNRNAHLTYINHLKESVETVREIVEEARVVKPLDNVLNYACQYTKLSQELVEYVIGTCPKEFTERDSKAPSIPLTRKKQVTFTNNTQKHGVHQKVQQSNVQVIPSTGFPSESLVNNLFISKQWEQCCEALSRNAFVKNAQPVGILSPQNYNSHNFLFNLLFEERGDGFIQCVERECWNYSLHR